MISKAYRFTCDWCGDLEYFDGENETDAKNEARANGWIMRKKHRCLCSRDCQNREVVAKYEYFIA